MARMVGAPKTLSDLRKLEAALRITCRACGLSWISDREALLRQLVMQQRSVAWSMLAGHFRCPSRACGSSDLRITAAAFADRSRPRRASRAVVDDALETLRQSALRRDGGTLRSPAVRLALAALKPLCDDTSDLAAFWRIADEPGGAGVEGYGRRINLSVALNGILRQLGRGTE